MHRRHFLQAAAATSLTAGLPWAAQAKPADPRVFAEALPSQQLLTPFKGVTDTTGERFTERLVTRGRWPAGLVGRFYRNGPALHERAGQRYHHWFDGDGMVQQFTLAGGQISHRGRMVRTAKLQAEQAAGRFLVSAFGTSIEGGLPITGADGMNVANTNALEHAGRVLAMWEGGSAYAMDPADLRTIGPVVWRPDAARLPFTAHPKIDSAGNLWNIGTQGKYILAWHIGPDGQLARLQMGESPYPDGMVHDMAVTERYLVVPLPPVKLNIGSQPLDGPRRFALEPGQPLRVLVMDKADIRRRKVFELPAQTVFHVGHAHEEADGQVVLSFIGAPDTWFLDKAAVAMMRGDASVRGSSQLQQVRLNMTTGQASVALLPGAVEFPRIDPRRIGVSGAQRARWLLSCAAGSSGGAAGQSALLHGLQLTHLDSGRTQNFDYGDQTVAEEHILVPKPGASGELDAWVLGTTFDARRQTTVLNLLDAQALADGPVAQADLPYILPLGFHGNFTAA